MPIWLELYVMQSLVEILNYQKLAQKFLLLFNY